MFRQKKIFENPNKTFDVIENKKKAIKLKEMGDNVFKLKRYDVAERFYSEALQLNPGSRPISAKSTLSSDGSTPTTSATR